MDRNRLQQAIQASQEYLLQQQQPEGYWWADLESNVTMLAEVILLHKIWQLEDRLPWGKAEQFFPPTATESRRLGTLPRGWGRFKYLRGSLSGITAVGGSR